MILPKRKLFFSLFLIGAAISALVFLLFIGFPRDIVIDRKDFSKGPETSAPDKPANPESPEIILLAVGDIMLDRGVAYYVKKTGNGDFKFLFSNVANALRAADISFANLESVISDKGRKVGSVNSFRALPQAAEALSWAGFDIVSAANNHAIDYTKEALEDSLKRLSQESIDYVGAGFNYDEAYSVKVKEVKNARVGFLAFNVLGSDYWRAEENYSGIAQVSDGDLEKIKQRVAEEKKKVDILIISFHWGDEYMDLPNRLQEKWGRALIDSGADLIIGHHPHVVQPIERYNNGWIAYSLGNFIFDQSFSKETMEGLLLEVKIKDRKIKEVGAKKIQMNNFFQPSIVE